jgi:hypothetical protein
MGSLSGLNLENIAQERLELSLYILGAVGLLYCFAGYKLFRFVLGLTGFLVAGSVAGVLSGWLSAGDLVVMLACGAFGGICGAMALTMVYKLGVFGLGCMAATLACRQLPMDMIDAPDWMIVLGAGIFGGMAALLLERPAMTLATAAIGAWMSTVSAYLVFSAQNGDKAPALSGVESLEATLKFSQQSMMWLLGGWLALTIVGVAFQMRKWKTKAS